ncbi:MAG TPA: hypothetical protein DIW81_21855 [Planctomycetaceae bacterium]|nr:hypothetical protein [Rubinisphaera sp.]HCS54196.1 hypothetical protein [Planctomycetaceae bacterium]|tara:strand:+ start:303 stop:728 length:426 start_codon:yes stop_codon:yes gene_type:complete
MHNTWPPKLDRLSSELLLNEFESAVVFSTDHWQNAELELDGGKLGIVIQLTEGNYNQEARSRIRDVLRHLPVMDNRILQSCIDEQRRSGHHGRNYQNSLMLVTITDNIKVTLWYVGTGVNTEWDESFFKDENGNWIYVERG